MYRRLFSSKLSFSSESISDSILYPSHKYSLPASRSFRPSTSRPEVDEAICAVLDERERSRAVLLYFIEEFVAVECLAQFGKHWNNEGGKPVHWLSLASGHV